MLDKQAQPALVFTSKTIGNHLLNQNCASICLCFLCFLAKYILVFLVGFLLKKLTDIVLSVKLPIVLKV